MTLETGIYIYLGGGAFWSFLMGCQGKIVDIDFLWSVILWPLCALSFAGQIVRRLFK